MAKYLMNVHINRDAKDEDVTVYDAATKEIIYEVTKAHTRIRAGVLFIYKDGKLISHFDDVAWNTDKLEKIRKSNYDRDKESIMKWQKDNVSRVVINLKKDEKDAWNAYAESRGIPLATLIRQLMQAEMNK